MTADDYEETTISLDAPDNDGQTVELQPVETASPSLSPDPKN